MTEDPKSGHGTPNADLELAKHVSEHIYTNIRFADTKAVATIAAVFAVLVFLVGQPEFETQNLKLCPVVVLTVLQASSVVIAAGSALMVVRPRGLEITKKEDLKEKDSWIFPSRLGDLPHCKLTKHRKQVQSESDAATLVWNLAWSRSKINSKKYWWFGVQMIFGTASIVVSAAWLLLLKFSPGLMGVPAG